MTKAKGITIESKSAGAFLKAADSENIPRVHGVVYSGGKINLDGWDFPVVIDTDGVEIGDVLLIADHEMDTASRLGSVEAEVKDGQIIYSGKITGTNDTAKNIIEQAKAGERWEVSIHAAVNDYELIREGKKIAINGKEFTGPFYHVTDSELVAVSIVTRGADPENQLNIAARRKNLMSNATKIVEAEKQAEQEERDRIEAIETVCNKYEGKVDADQMKSLKAEAIEGKRDLRDLTLSLVKASRPAAGIHVGGPVVDDRERLTASMLMKGAPDVAARKYEKRPEVLDFARSERLSATDICAHALRTEHRSIPNSREQMIRAAFSTDTLGSALTEVGKDVLLDAYRRTPAVWRSIAAIKSVPDFKEHSGIRPSDVGGVSEVAPDGELKHVKIDGTGYSFQIGTWGAIMTWTRQQAINDDVGAYAQAAQELGKRCARKVNDLVAQVLLDIAVELGATDLDSDGLSAAVQLLRNRTDADGDVIDIQPGALIVPPALEETARGLLESGEIAAAEGKPTGNVWKKTAELLVEPRLSNAKFNGNSSGRWLLSGTPQDSPIIVAFLNGNEAPQVEQMGLNADVSTLGYSVRVYGDFGAAEGDTKAIVPAEES